jgi:GntR family transcriptional regulator/MocR family aminotransferase
VADRTVRLQRILRPPKRFYPGAFWPGVPPVDQFPLGLWSRLATRCYRDLPVSQLYHGPAAGYPPLRNAIAEYLTAARGTRCSPDQVIVLSSAQEALELACRVLLDPGDVAWLEDPSWNGIHGAMISAGASIRHVPVDDEGLMVEVGIAGAPHGRLAYVSPSHQFPSGVTMSLDRRLALLDWAAQSGAWILEDDYDSEFRYTGRPLAALQGLDTAGCVLYIGTFNKILFPSLRIGYVVVPEGLVQDFLSVRRLGGQHAPTINQAILADFISEGHYARHLRRLRIVCRERRDALLEAATQHLPDLLDIPNVETGLHAIGWLPAGMDDVLASSRAAEHGVEAAALSSCYTNRGPRPGLVLGYGGLRPREIDGGMRRLAQALRSLPTAG